MKVSMKATTVNQNQTINNKSYFVQEIQDFGDWQRYVCLDSKNNPIHFIHMDGEFSKEATTVRKNHNPYASITQRGRKW